MGKVVSMNENMDLKKFLKILQKRYISITITSISIIIFTVCIVILAIKPTYEATESLLIGVFKNKDLQETQEITRIVASSTDFIKSPVVLHKVEKELKISNVSENIVVKNNYNSQIINIVVRSNDSKLAEDIANTVALVARDEMNKLLNSEDIKILSGPDSSTSLKRVDSPLLNIAIGLMVGIFAGIGIAMTREYLDDSVESEFDLEALRLTVLGEVDLKRKMKLKGKQLQSNKKSNKKTFRKLKLSPELVSTEQIRIIRTNIENRQKNCSLLLITSPNLSEQKSIISAKLAISMAEKGKKVLLIDGNLDNPSLHVWFNLDNKSGFTNVILNDGNLHIHSHYTYTTGLSLLTTGQLLDEPSKVWGSHNLENSITNLKTHYDLIIIESRDFLSASDSQILAKYCNDVLLVVKKNSTTKEDLIKTKKYLETGNKNILGVIFQVK